jgi:Ternary complex associated domain 9
LRGWRRQPFYDNQCVADGNVLHRLRRSRPTTYNIRRKRRLEKRRRSAGAAVRPFDELDAMLMALPAIRYRYGTTHGDLHGNNVRIAGADAILIDFASVDYGPLTVDPAALDVSLMMDTRLVAGDDWMRLADEVYELKALRAPAVPPRPERDAANLLDALHYIRQTAFTVQFSDVEYPVVVALQLLRKASYDGDDAEGHGAGCTPTALRTGSSVNWPTSISGRRPVGRPTLRKGRRA